jgi:ubiquinone biosynthesis protein Coq4
MYKAIIVLRSRLLVFLTHRMALPLLKIIRRPKRFIYTKEMLQQMPEGTLGNDLIIMLQKNKLELLPYYVKHDIKHILLGYNTTGEGEVCLQCFMLGNRHISFPVAATILFGLFTMPEHWPAFVTAFKRGKKSVAIEGWQWFSLLEMPTQALIEKINGNEKKN